MGTSPTANSIENWIEECRAPHLSLLFGSTRNARLSARSGKRPGFPHVKDELRRDLHVFEIARLVVDADARRRDPAGELAGLDDLFHQAADEIAVIFRWQPAAPVAGPRRLFDERARRRNFHILELADLAVKADMRQFEFERRRRSFR